MPEVRQERTGWRCEEISKRHREWGYNCPAVDLDFMVVEYNYGKPVALIEYKDKHAKLPSLDHPTIKALAALADGYKKPLPFFIAIYCPEDWWFRVIPINEIAKKIYKGKTELTEKRFVKSLYLIRNIALSDQDVQAINKLKDITPPKLESVA